MSRPIQVLCLLGSQTTDPRVPRTNGVEILMARLAGEFDPTRIRLHVAYPEIGPLYARFEAAGIPIYPWPSYRGWDVRLGGRIRDLIRVTGAAVLHTHSGPIDGFAARAASDLGIGHLITRHVAYGDLDVGPLRRAAYRWVDRSCAVRGSHWAAISADGRSKLLAQGLPVDRIHLIYNGFQAPGGGDRANARRSWGIRPEAKVIGYAGRMESVKRVDRMIRAFEVLSRDLPDCELVLAGGGPTLESLRRLADSLAVRDRVHFLGQVAGMPDFYAGIDVLALASDAEGVPNVLLEALSAGVGVVASRVGGTPEIVRDGETGRLFRAGSSQELTAGLREALAGGPVIDAWRERGRRLAHEEFGLARCAEAYSTLYESLAGGRA